jgi:hypothetical protein
LAIIKNETVVFVKDFGQCRMDASQGRTFMPYNIVSFPVTAIFLNLAVWGWGYAEVYQYQNAAGCLLIRRRGRQKAFKRWMV